MSTYTPPYQLTDAILRLSTEIAATVKEITVRGNLSAQPQLHRANRIRSVHSSLAIEHNSLTLDQVTALLNGKRVLAPQQEVWEVQNAFRAYDLLPSLDPYSIDDLLKVHRVMMDGLVMGAGTFRNTGVGVYAGDQLIHAGTPAHYVPEAMQQLLEDAGYEIVPFREGADVYIINTCSGVFHYEFEFIHPFADGNGRTGRLWQTLILRKWEPIFTYLPIESLILEHQADYYAALNAANTQGSATVFIEFMLEMILEVLKNVYVKQPEDQLLVLLKSDPRMTIPVMAEHLGLSDRQIRRLIASLKAQNRLHREGSNKTGRWVVSRKSR